MRDAAVESGRQRPARHQIPRKKQPLARFLDWKTRRGATAPENLGCTPRVPSSPAVPNGQSETRTVSNRSSAPLAGVGCCGTRKSRHQRQRKRHGPAPRKGFKDSSSAGTGSQFPVRRCPVRTARSPETSWQTRQSPPGVADFTCANRDGMVRLALLMRTAFENSEQLRLSAKIQCVDSCLSYTS